MATSAWGEAWLAGKNISAAPRERNSAI